MKMINNFNIKFKLGILLAILLISIAILGYTAINISQNNKNQLRIIHSKSQEVLNLQTNIITPLYELRELTQSLVMAPNNKIRDKIEPKLRKNIKSLEKNFYLLKNNYTNVFNMWINYKNLTSKTRLYLRQEFEEGAYINISTSSQKQFNILMNELLKIQKKSLSNSTLAYNKAVQKVKELKMKVISSIIFILILSVFAGWLVSSNIIKSIHLVQNGINEFFDYLNRKKEKASKIKLKTNDEFYQMANIINKNVITIQNNIEQNQALIKNATRILENIKSGNLGARLTQDTKDDALNELKMMINDMIDNLEYKIQEEIDKRLEQEQILIQQSKLAAMGEMIGNIAHQWRQPLAEISAIFMNMKVTYQFDNFTKEYFNTKIQEANKLTTYMSQTISDFQNFFNPQGEKEYFDVELACKDAYFIVASSLKYHGVDINFDIKEDSKVYGYKNEYAQVILNLLSNAKDILLERKIENPIINIEIKTGDNFAIVKIQDNGGGVNENILDKIFEPYFTTRHKTQGTGIGLYMSKNIIERNMNGYINVKNLDQGALFTIKIPRVK